MQHKWVVCDQGSGYLIERGVREKHKKQFPVHSVGLVTEVTDDGLIVYLIGINEDVLIPANDCRELEVEKTGDKYSHKICNTCHCLKPVEKFVLNQNNKHGKIRRPSCTRCRTDIDKRAPKSRQAKQMDEKRPKKGSLFKCPICKRRSIAGVTAKVVADHDHHTGNIRDFICDSCNTGLGRFKNGSDYLMNAIHYLKERDTL